MLLFEYEKGCQIHKVTPKGVIRELFSIFFFFFSQKDGLHRDRN